MSPCSSHVCNCCITKVRDTHGGYEGIHFLNIFHHDYGALSIYHSHVLPSLVLVGPKVFDDGYDFCDSEGRKL